MEKYLIPFLVAFFLTVAFIFLFLRFFKNGEWGKRAGDRHSHSKKNILRLGGLAVILSFNLAILLNNDLFLSRELWGVMIVSLLIALAGIWDDIKELSWKIQLFFQVIIASAVFLFGIKIYYLTAPFSREIVHLNQGIGVFVAFIVASVWIVMLMNALNWLDGVDGLSGGITAIVALTIFFLSLKTEVNQPPVAIISMILAGSMLGFLIFNFNPAKIMAGTAGSMFMGFTLAILAIFSGTKIATTLLVLAIPIIDFLWVIWVRWKNGKSIFLADNNHLHHKLSDLGWSPKKISLSLYLITGIMAVIALNTRAIGKGVTLFLTAVAMMVCLFVLNDIISKKSKLNEK